MSYLEADQSNLTRRKHWRKSEIIVGPMNLKKPSVLADGESKGKFTHTKIATSIVETKMHIW